MCACVWRIIIINYLQIRALSSLKVANTALEENNASDVSKAKLANSQLLGAASVKVKYTEFPMKILRKKTPKKQASKSCQTHSYITWCSICKGKKHISLNVKFRKTTTTKKNKLVNQAKLTSTCSICRGKKNRILNASQISKLSASDAKHD